MSQTISLQTEEQVSPRPRNLFSLTRWLSQRTKKLIPHFCPAVGLSSLRLHSNDLLALFLQQQQNSSRVDRVGDPVRGVSHAVVDAGLAPLGAGVSGADDADQGPPAIDLGHEWSAGIALAGVLSSLVVAGAHHLVVDDHPDALVPVPVLALAVVNGRDVNNLEQQFYF